MTSQNNNKSARNARMGVAGFFKKHKRSFLSLGAFAATMIFWLSLWGFAAMRVGVSFILPSPIEAFSEFFKLLPQREFISAIAGSIVRVITGYLLGISVGAVTAFISYFIPPLKSLFSPLMKVARATPVASFILICALWMTAFFTPVFIAFLMVFPIVYENVLTGLTKTDATLIEITSLYGFSPIKRLIYLYIPSAMPYLGSSCITSLGLAWKSCVSAEVLAVTAGSVGYNVYVSKLYLETEKLFAWTIAVILLSVALEYAVKAIARLVSHLTGRRFKRYE